MASSVPALAGSLKKVAERLNGMLHGQGAGQDTDIAFLADLEDEDLQAESEADKFEPADPLAVEAELHRVRNFIARAEALPRDSKAGKLLDAMRVISERPPERRRVVIFTESLVTQAYLESLLIQHGGYAAEAITLFRGVNDSARATRALHRWQQEIGEHLPPHQRPSRAVAIRLALVHEFKTRSQIFISTEAGAKGLNLQFCDTIVNYHLPWNPQRIEQRIGRCHRYSQEHDVTVINFLAADNEAERLTFEILSGKLDLFGKVLDASDVVLHQPSTDAPETLAGALGNDFEGRLRRIYERARTIHEVEAELRRLREEMDQERKRFEQIWARTAGLIEPRFDQRVKQVFRRLQADLPEGLAHFDTELDRLITGFLRAGDVSHRRVYGDGQIRFELSPSAELPEGWRGGGSIGVGRVKEMESADPLHLGHRLVRAAVEEARQATQKRLFVAWVLDNRAPEPLKLHRGKRGCLVLIRIRYEGFERVDRLAPIAIVEGETTPLGPACALWLLDQPPRDRPTSPSGLDFEGVLEDSIEEFVFADQAEVARLEQQRFERNLEQIERYIEDQLLVLRRHLSTATAGLRASEDKRDAALGSDARTEAEERIRKVQREIDDLERQIARLQNREDPLYERWREHAHH